MSARKIDPAEIARLRALCEAATDGPSLVQRDSDLRVVIRTNDADAAFIAAARTALPLLLDEVERLRAQRDRLREVAEPLHHDACATSADGFASCTCGLREAMESP